MSERRVTTIFSTPVASVYDVDCRSPRSPATPEEEVITSQIVVPRRGVFGISLGGRRFVAEPNSAVVLRSGTDYSVDHPASCGDRCTVIVFDAGTLEDGLGRHRSSHFRISPATELWARLLAGLREPVASEEVSTWFLRSLAGDVGVGRVKGVTGTIQQRRVSDVCALMAADPARPWRLDALAGAVHVSPYHLAHQFKAVTGVTLTRYLTRLRLAAALDRVADGERSLARVASETGFAHHSHLTERFRAFFGAPPSEVRRGLSGRGLAALRSRITTARS